MGLCKSYSYRVQSEYNLITPATLQGGGKIFAKVNRHIKSYRGIQVYLLATTNCVSPRIGGEMQLTEFSEMGVGVVLSTHFIFTTNTTACSYIMRDLVPITELTSYNDHTLLHLSGLGLQYLLMKGDMIDVFDNALLNGGSIPLHSHAIARVITISISRGKILLKITSEAPILMPREGARVLFKNGTHILPLFISVDNAKSANITVIDTYSVMASVHISIGEIAVGDLVTLRDCTVGMIHGCYNVTRRQTSNFSYSLILNVTHLATQEDFKVQFSKCRILLNRQLYVDKGNVSTPGLVSNCSGINTCGVITFMSILVLERLSITHGRAFGGAARFGLPIQSSMSSAEILSSTGFRVSNMIYAYISTTMRIPAGTHVKVSNCGQYESVVVKANLVQQQHILSVLLGDPMMNKDKTKMEVCIYDCQDELLHGVYDIISYSSPVNSKCSIYTQY